jgi:hypothetical protein
MVDEAIEDPAKKEKDYSIWAACAFSAAIGIAAAGGHIWQDALARDFHYCGGRDDRAVGICVPTASTRRRDMAAICRIDQQAMRRRPRERSDTCGMQL